MNKQIEQAAIIGGGVIGGGWVARFLLMGIDVNVFDPDPEAERKIGEVLNNARRSLPALYDHRLPKEGRLQFVDSLEQAVVSAQWIGECVPERLELKQKVIADIQTYCSADSIVASSTSGFKPSELQDGAPNPKQIIVAHPFNPVYLIPLVELVGDQKTCEDASQILTMLGFQPLVVRKEIDAHIADRLLEAVWREGLWLVNDGIATTQEIDDAISYGFGLRWAQMGLFETYRIAGGEAGMAHFIKQFGPALEWPWTKLMDVPELTDELINKIASQSDQHSGKYSIRELERIRDDNLVAMMRALKGRDWGAGGLLNKVDKALKADARLSRTELPITIERVIPVDWTDYNGHMNDSRYCDVFSTAADALMMMVGANQEYITAGHSYFTVDLQISYLQECHAGDAIKVRSRIVLADGKKLKLEHQMLTADEHETVLASCEQFLLHVSLTTRQSCEPVSPVAQQLTVMAEEHAALSL